MNPILAIKNLNKIYDDGFSALKDISLDIYQGEIFALLGPNGAGKTTLINAVCGIINTTSGDIFYKGQDIKKNYRAARKEIGLVPQELSGETFESVLATVAFSRGLFGYSPSPEHIEKILKKLSLWDKRHNRILTLSGGMKRRVMIAKALSHEPQLLFLDEPTAGVDVELRRRMWDQVLELKETGVTIILTTHYIEEAEEIADRVGVINRGRIIATDDKRSLMKKFGKKKLVLDLNERLGAIPPELLRWNLVLSDDGMMLKYHYDLSREDSAVSQLLSDLYMMGIRFKDVHTNQTSLEEIFIELVNQS